MEIMYGLQQKTVQTMLRFIQILSIGSVITGFIWSSSDFLIATILASAPVTPLSALLIQFYGVIGTFGTELSIRWINRKRFLSENTKKKQGKHMMTLAMILSIVIATLTISGAIMYYGVQLGDPMSMNLSPVTSEMNSTLYTVFSNVYTTFSIDSIFIIFVPAILVSAIILWYIVSRQPINTQIEGEK